MSRIITYDSQGRDITCMKEFDALKYPCQECDREDCDEKEEVEAKWSGSYPCLCYGKWTLKVNGEDVSDKIPKDLRDSSMNTYGTYRRWHFENWLEVFENYESGLECDDWISKNKEWLNDITTDLDIQREIYYAINKQDFRSGSCGGCI